MHWFQMSFAQADRGKSLIARVALPVGDTSRSLTGTIQNSARGVIANISLSHDGTNWVGAGGTVLIDTRKGQAVLSVLVPLSASLNSLASIGVSPGAWQALCFYEPGKDQFVDNKTGMLLTDLETKETTAILDAAKSDMDALKIQVPALDARVGTVEAKLSATAPISIPSAVMSSTAPALVAADRNGSSPSEIAFTYRDTRTIAVGDAKLQYESRKTSVTIPVSAFTAEALTGWTYNVIGSINGSPARKTFSRSYTLATGQPSYNLHVQWEKANGEMRVWFHSQHSTDWTLSGVRDVIVTYAVDGAAIDPAFAAFARSADLQAEAARAIAEEKNIADKIRIGGLAELSSAAIGQGNNKDSPALFTPRDIALFTGSAIENSINPKWTATCAAYSLDTVGAVSIVTHKGKTYLIKPGTKGEVPAGIEPGTAAGNAYWVDASGLSEYLKKINQTGSYMGSAATYVGLPMSSGFRNALGGDFAILTAQDGANPPGIYVLNGAYQFSAFIPTETSRFAEITGTTSAAAGAGVAVLTIVPYSISSGFKMHDYVVEIQAASGWWYQQNFNPGGESDYRFRISRTPSEIRINTTPDAGVTSALNGRPYRIGMIFSRA